MPRGSKLSLGDIYAAKSILDSSGPKLGSRRVADVVRAKHGSHLCKSAAQRIMSRLKTEESIATHKSQCLGRGRHKAPKTIEAVGPEIEISRRGGISVRVPRKLY